MTEVRKQWWVRIGLGAVLGALLAPPAAYFISGFTIGPAAWVSPALAESLGLGTALALQSLLGALFGAVVLLATLPFAEDGKELVIRSLLHFAATALTFSALLWGAKWVTNPLAVLGWILMLGVLYLLIWLGRWIGWYREVVQLRTMLGLAPGPSPLRWRETLSYLPFVLLVCDLLPALLAWIDRTFVVDVPVFSGLLYPYLGLPIVGFCSGLSLGKRQGMCWLYPLACFVCYFPMVFLLFNSSALFHCFMIAVPALAGNLVGWAIWKKKE